MRASYHLQYSSPEQLETNLKQCNEGYYHQVPLGINCYNGAYVLPGTEMGGGGIVTESGDYIDGSYLHKGIGFKYSFDDYIEDNHDVVYLGMFHDVWGHCLSDNIQHLWFLYHKDFIWAKSLRFVYTSVFMDFTPPTQFIELLRLLGVEWGDLYRITAVTKFHRLYFADDSIQIAKNTGLRYYTNEYKQLIDNILSMVPINHHVTYAKRVYFSRCGFPSKKDFGEKYIEKAFDSCGYQIIRPESMSLEEQIQIIYNSDVLATTEGSISMNALFMREGSSLVLLRKGAITSYQHMINDIRGLDVTIIDAHKSSLIDTSQPWLGPFFLYCNKNLASFLGIRKPTFPFLAYFIYLMRNRFVPELSKKHTILRRKMNKLLKAFF